MRLLTRAHARTHVQALKADISKTLSKTQKNTYKQIWHLHTLTHSHWDIYKGCSHIIHVYTQTHTYKQKWHGHSRHLQWRWPLQSFSNSRDVCCASEKAVPRKHFGGRGREFRKRGWAASYCAASTEENFFPMQTRVLWGTRFWESEHGFWMIPGGISCDQLPLFDIFFL